MHAAIYFSEGSPLILDKDEAGNNQIADFI